MSQSLAQLHVHLVFSTKDRRPFLADRELRSRLHAYIGGTCRNRDSPVTTVGGVEDHVHVLCSLGRSISISELVRELKRESSKWLKEQAAGPNGFRWQAGYGAFSVSPSHVPALVRYVDGQENHHRRVSFQDEFRKLCRKYGVEIDERYAWD